MTEKTMKYGMDIHDDDYKQDSNYKSPQINKQYQPPANSKPAPVSTFKWQWEGDQCWKDYKPNHSQVGYLQINYVLLASDRLFRRNCVLSNCYITSGDRKCVW